MEGLTIRPITRRLPAEKALWDDTNLPLCVVLTPGANSNALVAKDRLTNILKCLECGAPHPTKDTHFRYKNKLLCYLCGEVSSTKFSDQYAERRDLEPTMKSDAFQNQKPGKEEEKDEGPETFGKEAVFQIPLYNNKIWSVPAMMCPPVWWIVLDASQTSSRSYWTAVGSVIEHCLDKIPPHVHVGMVAASATQVSSWDLASAMPHVWNYPYTSTDVDLSLVPANSLHLPNIHTALRAIEDAYAAGAVSGKKKGKRKGKKGSDNDATGMSLGLVLEVILEFMEKATHPGKIPDEDDLDDDANPQDDESEEEEEEESENSDDSDDDDNEKAAKVKEEKPKPAPTKDKKSDWENLPSLPYAGGRILCLLGNRPSELEAKDEALESQPDYHQGGVAGACSHADNTKWKGSDAPDKEPTDVTPENLAEYVEPLDPEDVFQSIGTRCGTAALGVDIIVIVPEEAGSKKKSNVQDNASSSDEDDDDSDDDDSDESVDGDSDDDDSDDEDDDSDSDDSEPKKKKKKSPKKKPKKKATKKSSKKKSGPKKAKKASLDWYGLPLLRPLADTSGAPGPLILGSENIPILIDQVLARTPWQPGTCFGTEVRIRLPPGFDLEGEPIEKVGRAKLQLAPFLASEGAAGPTVAVERELWAMGTCDPYTSITVDLQVEKQVPDEATMEGYSKGDIKLKHVLQTSTAYTRVQRDEETGRYETVRHMKVSHVPMPLEEDTEQFLDAMDVDATTAILFQKLVLSAYQDGLAGAQETAERWLMALLVCVYQSAIAEQAKRDEGLSEDDDDDDSSEDEDSDDDDSDDDDESEDEKDSDDEEDSDSDEDVKPKKKSKGKAKTKKSKGKAKKKPKDSDSEDDEDSDDDEEEDSASDDENSDEDSDSDEDVKPKKKSKGKGKKPEKKSKGKAKKKSKAKPKKKAKGKKGKAKKEKSTNSNSKFKGCNRLVDLADEGKMSEDDVILGLGHPKIAQMVSTVYGLLQCDALRPSCGKHCPSMDARSAAITQLSSMPPSAIAKYIVPRLELWSVKEDKPIESPKLCLSKKAILQAIKKVGVDDSVLLFVDSPQSIMVYSPECAFPSQMKDKGSPPLLLGSRLESRIEEAKSSYRTEPPVHIEITTPTKASVKEVSARFDGILWLDKATVGGESNFKEWKSKISEAVREELVKNKDI